MTIEWYNVAGYVGVLLVVLAFLLLQMQRLRGNGLIYQMLNILGAIGVILSLVFGERNYPALVLEVAWALIGVYGIVRNRRQRQALRNTGRSD